MKLVLPFLLAVQTLDILNLNNGELVLPDANLTSPPNLHREVDGTWVFSVKGKPARVLYNLAGTQLAGESISGEVVPLPGGHYELKSAEVAGGADLLVDSGVADRFLKARGQAVTTKVNRRSEFKTESFVLGTDTQDQQSVTVPGPLRYDDRSLGLDKDGARVEQVTHIDGRKANLSITPAVSGEALKIRTGRIEGQVHYHSDQTVTTFGKAKPAVKVTRYDLVADRLDIDSSGPEGKLIASGHVRYSVDGEWPVAGNLNQLTLTTDDQGQIQTISGEGTPAHTDVHVGKETKP